jgi:hypothetical protein
LGEFSPTYLALFSTVQFCALILAKGWLGYVQGDFFKNLNGHPAAKEGTAEK